MSDLRSRLRALEMRLGVGVPNAPEPVARDGSLAERLQRLAPRGAHHRSMRSCADVALLLSGRAIGDGAVVVDATLSLSHMHGRVRLARIAEVPFQFIAGDEEPNRERLLFVDTETNGLAGGTGTIVFVLGLARIRGTRIELRQYVLSAFRGEAAMLEHALEWMSRDCRIVSFNGKSFDAPLLSTRFRLSLARDPLDGLPHIDLLHRTRAAFQRNWPDCRLQTAEHHLLGLHRTDDIPGHLIPRMWTDWVQHGDTGGLPRVVEHNRLDVLSLIALAAVVGEAYATPGHEHADPLGVARAHRRAGDRTMARRHLEESREQLSCTAQLELADLYARDRCWEHALALWESLAQRNVWAAMERLAIYHEHRRRDYDAALQWTERMRPLHDVAADVDRRHARLLRRRAAQSTADETSGGRPAT